MRESLEPRPRRLAPPAVGFALVVVGLFLLATPVPGLVLASTSVAATHRSAAHAIALAPPPAPRAAHGGLAVHPNINCPMGGIPYYPIGWNWPLNPAITYQSPCNPPVQQDEVHGTFTSAAANSAERFSIPLYLPPNGSVGQANTYNNTYVGMVVRGNNNSAWNQSFAEVSFIPHSLKGSFTYVVFVSVFSLMNDSRTVPACSSSGAALFLYWNNSLWCEDQMINSEAGYLLSAGLSPNANVNITFAGQVGGKPITIYVNDSTNPGQSGSFQLSKANTGSYNYTPFYNSSCQDVCHLQWGMGFGMGIGVTMCPAENGGLATCNSYNSSAWARNPPFTWGIPEYYSGGSYGGDYTIFAPESASGACGGLPLISVCIFNNVNGGNGYYPLFSFNGSRIIFGNLWPWSYETFNGALQFPATASWRNNVPFYLFPYNSSLGGFVGSGNPINVSAWLMDMGSVTGATLHYLQPGGSWTTLAMTRFNGTLSNAFWYAVIPSGGNGLVTYWISATNHAGSATFSGNLTVQRGALPTFHLQLTTAPGSCGGIVVNGSFYRSGTSLGLYPGPHPFSAKLCYPYIFFNWSVTRGLFLSPNASVTSGSLLVTANGTLTGNWKYIRPHDQVNLATSPASCGRITLNGSSYTNGGSTQTLWDALSVTLTESGCGGYTFSGWTFVGNFSILGSTFTPYGNGTLQANYIASNSVVFLTFYTSPTTCGGVGFRGAGYTNGETLGVASGTYKIYPIACAKYVFRNWSSSSSGVSVSGNNVTVSSGGWVRATDEHATYLYLYTSPPSCGVVQFDGVNYTNGALLALLNNSTHTAYGLPCPGYYFNGWYSVPIPGVVVSGNIVTVNTSGSLTAVFVKGSPNFFVAFLTDPPTCGSVTFEGVKYRNSNFTRTGPGTVATLVPNACQGYNFTRWITTGAITVVGGNAYINGSGSITGVFRPLVPILLYTVPLGCGSIVLDHTTYLSNTSVALPIEKTFNLRAFPCRHYVFTGWSNTSGANVVGNTVYFTSSALITANFAPARYIVTVTISPASCGALALAGQLVENGTILGLNWGNYTLRPIPCAGDHLSQWAPTGNLTVNASGNVTHLVVNGSGVLGAQFLPVPPTVALSVGGGGYAGQPVALFATVGVPVPPYNYSYHWTFGDGTSATTSANFTTHTFASPGTYVVKMHVIDPFNRSADATLPVQVTSGPTLAGAAVYWPGVAAIALVIVALAIAGLIAARRRPPTTTESAPTFGAPPPEAADAQFRAVNSTDSIQQ